MAEQEETLVNIACDQVLMGLVKQFYGNYVCDGNLTASEQHFRKGAAMLAEVRGRALAFVKERSEA